jgi:hypothetical protein
MKLTILLRLRMSGFNPPMHHIGLWCYRRSFTFVLPSCEVGRRQEILGGGERGELPKWGNKRGFLGQWKQGALWFQLSLERACFHLFIH